MLQVVTSDILSSTTDDESVLSYPAINRCAALSGRMIGFDRIPRAVPGYIV